MINEIFKFPPHFDPFCQINYLFELFSGYQSNPIQKLYICASFQTSGRRFRKLQEAIWLTVIYEISDLASVKFREIQHFSQNLTDFVNYKKPKQKSFYVKIAH